VAFLMKAKIIVDDLEISPSAVLTEAEEAQTVERLVWRNGADTLAKFWRRGAILERSDSFLLVQMGKAEAVDEECRMAVAMTSAQLAEAQHAARRLAAGIHPEDFGLYDAGIILGYNGDGTYKPGPNFDQMPQDEDDEDDE
jgi:hypothetical protein